jgi:TRAP-type mannitol/chloroaromatic compound transport system substrate-binding protein
MRRNRIGMSRRQFLGAAGAGAAGLVGAAMYGSGVGYAASPPVPPTVYFENRLPGLIDYDNCRDFFVHTLAGELNLTERPRTDNDVFARVSSGELQVGCGLASQVYSSLSREGNYFLGIPFGFEPRRHKSWLLQGGGLQLQREIYEAHNVVPVPIAVVPESGGHFLERIPDDPAVFNATGWKLRWFGIGQEVLSLAFPNLEFASAVAGGAPLAYFGSNSPKKKHTLDGFEFATPNTDWDLVYNKKVHPEPIPGEEWPVYNPAVAGARYYYKTWHQTTQVFEFWFNMDYWDSLGPSGQASIESAMRKTLTYAVNISQEDSLDKIEAEIAAAAAGEPSAVGLEWPEDVLSSLKDKAAYIYQRDASANRNINDILESMSDFGWEFYY